MNKENVLSAHVKEKFKSVPKAFELAFEIVN